MTQIFESFIVQGIKQFYREFCHLYDQHLAEYGLTSSQVNVLEQLWTHGDGMTQKDLHERLKIKPASLSNVLDTLEAGAWLERRPDPQDARVKRIFLTQHGHDQRELSLALNSRLESLVREGLNQAELSALTSGVEKLRHNLPGAAKVG